MAALAVVLALSAVDLAESACFLAAVEIDRALFNPLDTIGGVVSCVLSSYTTSVLVHIYFPSDQAGSLSDQPSFGCRTLLSEMAY